MKLVKSLVALFCAAVVSSRVQSPLGAADDVKYKVPGKNPLEFEHDPEDYILKICQLNLEPNPPSPGKTLKIQLIGQLNKEVDEGSFVDVSVKYEGIFPILTKDFDLCENAGAVDEACPLHSGFWNVSKEVTLPSQIPPGTYKIIMQAYTDKTMEEKISCMKGEVAFKAT